MAEALSEEIIEAIPFEALEANSVLRYTIFTKQADTYNIYLQRGKRFGMGERSKLKSKRVEYVYIKQVNKKLFLEDILKRVDEIDKNVKSPDALVLLYHDLLSQQMKEVFDSGLNSKNLDLIKRFTPRIVDLILSSSSCVAKLINTIEDHDKVYEHSMNVMVYSLSLGKMLGIKQEQLEVLAFGSLFHDIAKSEDAFTDNNHPQKGVEILEKNKFNNKIVKRIVLEHHEFIDGTGFPNSLESDEISQFSQIVTIANTFDNLCSSDGENFSTFESLKYMKSKILSKLNAQALNSFILMFKKHS